MTEQALQYLNQNPLRNVSMTEPIRRGRAEILKADAEGVLLKVMPENLLMLSADTLAKGMELLADIDAIEMIVVHQEFLIEPIMQKYKKAGCNICDQVVYTKKEPFFIPADADIRLLDESYCEIMAAHYHLSNDPEYMRKLVKLGVMHGIFVENKLAGFIGMHSEGSMGLLEIFPEYQNRGLGTLLQKYMINFVLQKGWIPYGQVIVGNKESMGLQHKLDMELADGKVTWIFGQQQGSCETLLSDETIDNVSLLAKLELSPKEKEQAKQDMRKMLAYIDKQNELDTTSVEPMSHIFPVQNVFREDIVENDDNREAILKNAPAKKDGSFVVPKTLG